MTPRRFEPRWAEEALVAWPSVAWGGGGVGRGDFIDRLDPEAVPGGDTAESIKYLDRCLRGTVVRSEGGVIIPPGQAEVARLLACKLTQEAGGWPSLSGHRSGTPVSMWELRVKWVDGDWPDLKTLRAINQDDRGARDMAELGYGIGRDGVWRPRL